VLAIALVMVGACARHASADRSSASDRAANASGVTHPAGSDCRATMVSAVWHTLSAPSYTVEQSPWREHLAGPTVGGGGAAVIYHQAPDRERVVPRTNGSQPAIETVVVGRRWWQGSARAGWAAFTTRTPSDPLAWLQVPLSAPKASWQGSVCSFDATLPQGHVQGSVRIESGQMTGLTMRLRDRGTTIDMAYAIARIGSSPPVTTPS
jgi:hypothetical protein